MVHSSTESDRLKHDLELWLNIKSSQEGLFHHSIPLDLVLFSIDSANSVEIFNFLEEKNPGLIIDTRLSPHFRNTYGSVVIAKENFNASGCKYIRVPLNYTGKEKFGGCSLDDFCEVIEKYRVTGEQKLILVFTGSDYQHYIISRLIKNYCKQNVPNVSIDEKVFDSNQTGFRKEMLIEILQSAYLPCKFLDGKCSETCNWNQEIGLVPSGFGGATGSLSDVKLIIVCTEPISLVDPVDFNGNSIDMVKNTMKTFEEAMDNGKVIQKKCKFPGFYKNLQTILNYFWKESDTENILRQTWITNSVLCPISRKRMDRSRMQHSKIVEDTCIKNYLKPQLELFNKPFILALGKKSRDRMNQNGINFHAEAYHPNCRETDISKKKSWQNAASKFHEYLKECR